MREEDRLAVHRHQRLGCPRVREVDPRQLVPEQSAREHVDLVMRCSSDLERETALRIGAAPPPAVRTPVPELDHAVADRHVLAVEQLSDQLHRRVVVTRDELVLGAPAKPDRVEGTDRLRRRAQQRHVSTGVVREPPRPSTMSHWKPSAHSGCVVSRSKRATSSARDFGSRTELKIGSYGNSGSPGKYICVTSRWVNSRPKTEKWMCAGRHAFSWLPHGYAPGLTVTKR